MLMMAPLHSSRHALFFNKKSSQHHYLCLALLIMTSGDAKRKLVGASY
jgi:hypothetical protein